MPVLELRGYKGLQAFQAFHKLMLGLKMLPAYMGESYEDFYGRVSEMPEIDQEKLIREAVVFVPLEKDEVEALIAFYPDANGVPYGAYQMKSLDPKQLHEIMVAVACEISKIKVDLVSESEKKKLAAGA